jgi:hypothetical protein
VLLVLEKTNAIGNPSARIRLLELRKKKKEEKCSLKRDVSTDSEAGKGQ